MYSSTSSFETNVVVHYSDSFCKWIFKSVSIWCRMACHYKINTKLLFTSKTSTETPKVPEPIPFFLNPVRISDHVLKSNMEWVAKNFPNYPDLLIPNNFVVTVIPHFSSPEARDLHETSTTLFDWFVSDPFRSTTVSPNCNLWSRSGNHETRTRRVPLPLKNYSYSFWKNINPSEAQRFETSRGRFTWSMERTSIRWNIQSNFFKSHTATNTPWAKRPSTST